MEPGPFPSSIYWPHVVFGIGSTIFVLLAIFSAKGGKIHRRSGQCFAAFMSVAAVSAIAFSLVRFAPPALFSAFSVLYGIGMGILSLRKRRGIWRIVQLLLPLIPLALVLLGLAALATLFAPQPEPIPIPIVIIAASLTSAVILLFGWLFVGDVDFLRTAEPDRFRRFRRHALRMAVAAAETVRAPLISFGPALGPDGAFSFPVYFFGPFLLIPLIYYVAMPAWVKTGEEKRAAQLSTAVA